MTQKALLQSAGDGTAVPQGYVGQKITWSTPPAAETALTTTETDWANASFQLTPGIWHIFCSVTALLITPAVIGAEAGIYLKITDGSNAVINQLDRSLYIRTQVAANAVSQSPIVMSDIITVTSTTTYKIRGQKYQSSGTADCRLYNTSPSSLSNFYAVRIA